MSPWRILHIAISRLSSLVSQGNISDVKCPKTRYSTSNIKHQLSNRHDVDTLLLQLTMWFCLMMNIISYHEYHIISYHKYQVSCLVRTGDFGTTRGYLVPSSHHPMLYPTGRYAVHWQTPVTWLGNGHYCPADRSNQKPGAVIIIKVILLLLIIPSLFIIPIIIIPIIPSHQTHRLKVLIPYLVGTPTSLVSFRQSSRAAIFTDAHTLPLPLSFLISASFSPPTSTIVRSSAKSGEWLAP